jgi:hypothetical protein
VGQDGATDSLGGALGRDWFVVSSEDVLSDQATGETRTLL